MGIARRCPLIVVEKVTFFSAALGVYLGMMFFLHIFAMSSRIDERREIREQKMKRTTKRLTELELRGFKSIAYDYPMTLDLRDVNILLGANGAGKSNIVSFFKMLGYLSGGKLQKHIAMSGTSQMFLHYGVKKTPSFSASLKFGNFRGYERYTFSLANAVPDRLIIASEEIEWNGRRSGNEEGRMKLEPFFNESALLTSASSVERDIYDLINGCKVFQFSDSSATSSMLQASSVDSAHYLQSQADNLPSFLYFLKNNYPYSYNRIVNYVREVVPQFKDFYLEPERGWVSLKWEDTSANDYIFSAHQFSDGSIRFIALATLLLQPEETMPGVIIIDEPELGLHPYAIDSLCEMIHDASLHAQIIVATQSPAIVDGFSIDDVIIMERDPEKQCTIARRLNSEDYKEWIEEYSLSELWAKNVIGGRPI